ncbi:hypothetical protein [Dongshaea marina]|uniref:hypothetical protein n=1 Tax=Dongshaea marina TaxID=2047966 RepID=UPI000D3E36C1|nr:hypothetical protein [Dongshaea marina]
MRLAMCEKNKDKVDINQKINEIFQGAMSSPGFSEAEFREVTHELLGCLTIATVLLLSHESKDELRNFHKQVVKLISRDKFAVEYDLLTSYSLVLNLISPYVITSCQSNAFMMTYRCLSFIELLKEITLCNSDEMQMSSESYLNELENQITDEILLALDESAIVLMNKSLAKLASYFSMSFRTKDESIRLDEIIEKKINPVVGYNPYIIEQKIIIELNPLDETFSTKPLSFSSNPEQVKNKHSKYQGFVLSNYHIDELDISLQRYGFNGITKFKISYNELKFHSDYQFLYDNSPLSVLITIENSYIFDDSEQEDGKYKKKIYLQAVGNLEQEAHIKMINPLVTTKLTGDQPQSGIASIDQEFQVEFCDPAHAFWKFHKPVYIDQNKSYIDVFDENNFFQSWAQFDIENCTVLAEVKAQIAIGTHERTFYDYFIEILESYDVQLIYDYDSASKENMSKYYLYDNPSTLEATKKELHEADLQQIKEINCDIRSPIALNSQISNLSMASSVSTDLSAFSEKSRFQGIIQVDTSVIGDQKINSLFVDNKIEKLKSYDVPHKFLIRQNELMPYFSIYPGYEKFQLITEQFESSVANYCDSISILSVLLKYRQNDLTRRKVKNKIKDMGYRSEDESDRAEKITLMGESLGLTHHCQLDVVWSHDGDEKKDYPEYIPFRSFTSEAEIITGDKVDESIQKGYMFYTLDGAESSFADEQGSEREKYQISTLSEKVLCYAIILPQCLYKSDDVKGPFYVPVKYSGAMSNMFMPLRNQDVIRIEIINAEEMAIDSVVSNTATINDLASVEMSQRLLFGANKEEQVMLASSTPNGDSSSSTFEITQKTTQNEVKNKMILSEKSGFSLLYFGSDGEQG